MKKAPPSAEMGAVCDPIPRFGHIRKLKTVTQFGHILASKRRVFLTFLGSVFKVASQGGPRAAQGLQKGTPGGESMGKGGIPKVVPPLYEVGPPQRWRRSAFKSTRAS